MSQTRLTEEEKKAVSLNLGHSNVGTTFGSYGYGSMNEEEAIKIVQRLKAQGDTQNRLVISAEQKAMLENLLKQIS